MLSGTPPYPRQRHYYNFTSSSQARNIFFKLRYEIRYFHKQVVYKNISALFKGARMQI